MLGHKDDPGGPPTREEVEARLRASGTSGMADVEQATPHQPRDGLVEWEFRLKIHPDRGRHFTAEFRQRLPENATFARPAHVLYDGDHHVMMDPAQLGEQVHLPTLEVRGNRVTVGGGPKWVVPHECPTCGAVVDQAVSSYAQDPRCDFCHQALPVQPAPG